MLKEKHTRIQTFELSFHTSSKIKPLNIDIR